jgi:uncharacterized protein (DUF433 family)
MGEDTALDTSPVAVLNRPLFTLTEAARLLELPPRTLRNWLEGFTSRATRYPGVIRMSSTGSTEVTWAEFVEAGYLREYRVKRGVSLQRLRRFIELGHERWGVPYPLAHFKPIAWPRGELLVLLKQLQEEAELDDELHPVLVEPHTGQLVFSQPLRAWFDKVDFDQAGIASRMHPLGRAFPVVIDPLHSFGIPQVGGIRTEILAEAIATGEPEESLADTYNLTLADVRAAIRWELMLRPRTEAAA